MLVRPRDLADRLSANQETFTLPIEAARLKARQILDQLVPGSYVTVVEKWCQLPGGEIEFTTRRISTGD